MLLYEKVLEYLCSAGHRRVGNERGDISYLKGVARKGYQRAAKASGQMVVVLSRFETVNEGDAHIAYAGAYSVAMSHEYAVDALLLAEGKEIAVGAYSRLGGFIAESEISVGRRYVHTQCIAGAVGGKIALFGFGK